MNMIRYAETASHIGDDMNVATTPVPSLEELQGMPVHPIAAMFPMLGDDELAELADDIVTNGVNHPVVITRDGMLIDGRNRIAACAIAKVEPPVAYFEGDDAAAFIISENVNRRHLSKSQRAMAVAKAFPNPAAYKRGAKSLATKELASEATLSQARSVIRLAPDLVDQVLAGSMTVDIAYKQASLRKSEGERRLDRIRTIGRSHPEFAEGVSNGTLTIDEAEAKLRAAEEARKQQRWAYTKNICDAVMMLDRPADTAELNFSDFDPVLAEQGGHHITSERLLKVAAYAAALADLFEEHEGD